MEINAPFIVFGPSKSGTTWLQKLLDSMPDVRCHFQIPLFPFDKAEYDLIAGNKAIAYNANKTPFKNLFKSEEEERIYKAVNSFLTEVNISKTRYLDRVLAERSNLEIGAITEVFHRFHRSLLADRPSVVYGTKAYTNIDNYFRVYPHGKVIFIVRDGRDAIVSKRFHSLRMGVRFNGDEKSRLLTALLYFTLLRKVFIKMTFIKDRFKENLFLAPEDLERSKKIVSRAVIKGYGDDWALVSKYILEMHKKYSANTMIVKYEDLRTNLDEHLRKIVRFLDTAIDPGFNISAAKVSNGKVKFSSDSFFRKGQAGDWVHYFKDDDIKYFNNRYYNLMKELNYEL